MKIKIYWRLAVLLSVLTAIVWGIVYLVNGNVPKWYLYKLWYDEFDWVIKLFPSWMLSRWWDIVGVLLFTLTIHTIVVLWRSEKNPPGAGGTISISYILKLLSFAITSFGIVIGIFMLMLVNALIAFIVVLLSSIMGIAMMLLIDYLSEKEVVNKTGRWIMQKIKEE